VASIDPARSPSRDWILAAGAALGLLLPAAGATVLMAAVALASFRRRGGRGSTALQGVALLLALAAGVLGVEWWTRLAEGRPEVVGRAVADRFEELWNDLERAADSAVLRLEPLEDLWLNRLGAFNELAAEVAEHDRGVSLLLLDPDSEAEAWAGEGLLHELDGPGVPVAGRFYRAGLQAATLAVARPLGGGPRPWRVVAGRTFATESFPAPYDRLGTIHWTPFGPTEQIPDGLRSLTARPPAEMAARSGATGGTPWIAVTEGELSELALRAAHAGPRWRRVASGLVALALLVDALLGLGLSAGGRSPGGRSLAGALGAAVAAALAFGGTRPGLLALLVGTSLFAGLSWRARGRLPGDAVSGAAWKVGSRRWGLHWALAGAAAIGGLGLLAAALQWGAPVDLGSDVGGKPTAAVIRIVVFLWVLGCLAWARGPRPGIAGRVSRWTWASLGAATVAAGAVDYPWIAWSALSVAALLLAGWIGGQEARVRPPALIIAALLSTLIAGGGWETAYRSRLRTEIERVALPELALPTAAEREAVRSRIEAAFDALDLRQVALRDPRELEAQDLALAVWSHSPLAVQGMLSALIVDSDAGGTSAFSFGLPIAEGEVDLSPAGGSELPEAVFETSLVSGSSLLRLDGLAWGSVRFWALLRPGFRRSTGRVGELAEGLLRGGPAAFRPDRALLGPARYMAYDAAGSPVLSAWSEAPPIGVLEPGEPRLVELEDGPAWAFATASEAMTQALFLPRLRPIGAAERVATHAVGVLLVLAGVVLAGLLVRWREALGALRRALRHYSKRLILVYSAFLLLPILVVNGVAVRVLADRLQGEQRAAGRLALESASRILGEYVLTLDPGFGLETTLDDALLSWLSRVVRHEVNLYWGSSVYASSLRELFTAGLLPERIPGEIYSRLALRSTRAAARTNRAGDTSYLELYGTVAIPGVPAGSARLVLSLPLLAQEEELAAEIHTLRRRALLFSVAAALLLVAIGARLARTFTEPLLEVIEGTQRIAAGAESTDVEPTEEDLGALVRAIDQMAQRIAGGRRELMREKEVVERMIDHITSGVVSVDRGGRVVMANRIAQRLLQVQVGDALDDLASRRPTLAPLALALEGAIADGVPRTVRLTLEAADGAEGQREWTLVWVELAGDGEPSGLLVVEDVTEVLRGQRLQAWAEMARMIAHEIKNPLTPIRLSTEHMREVRTKRPEQFDAVFERCTHNILTQVSELQLISSEFLTYSRIPRCEPVPGDLVKMARDLVEVYRTAPPEGVEIALEAGSERIVAEFDERLLGRALRNLVENAVRASSQGGRVVVGVQVVDGAARLSVSDEGPGVPPENLGRIFEPYFSTHDTGTGLGLPIAQRIAEEHGGTVQARNLRPHGLEVSLLIPRRA
jgi:signal transduction histidine kinase